MRAHGSSSFVLVGLLAPVLGGCPPQIGDDCQSSIDCSAQESRLCDTTQPGGYCTVFNCEPDGCFDEGVCIAFNARLSVVAGCESPNGPSRYARSFCMANCESDGDCRSDYVCADMSDPNNPWGAVLADEGSPKVCVAPMSGGPIPSDRSNEVCTGTDAGFPEPDAAGGAAGAGGAPDGAAGGAGGDTG